MTKYNFFRSLLVALLIPFTLACTGLSIFIANSTEMSGTISTLIPPLCALAGLVALILFLVQLPYFFVKKNWFAPVNLFLFGCGFLLYFQANVFNWNFGELDGNSINWSAFRLHMVLEIIVYAAIIGFMIWKRQWLNKYVIHLTCLLMLMQAVPLANPLVCQMFKESFVIRMPQTAADASALDPTIPSWKQYETFYDGFFDYSPEQNVVLLIPDAMGKEMFERLIKKHPEVLEWFADFNYFPHQKSQAGTVISIPQILTACDDTILRDLTQRHKTKDYDPDLYVKTIASFWNSEGALQKTLAEAGFQTRLHTCDPGAHHYDHRWISNIRLKNKDRSRKGIRWNDLTKTGIGQMIDLALVRSVPIVCKPADIDQFHPIQVVFQRITKASFRETKGMSDQQFVRLLTEHPVSAASEKPVLNVIHLYGAHPPYRLNENFEYESMRGIEGEYRQAFAAFRVIKRLIDDMKTAGVYDNSLLVIGGDHGSRNPDLFAASFHNPLLLVKRQNERHEAMVYREEYTNVQDITPTILELAGLKNPPGRFSIFDLPSEVLVQREREYQEFWAEKAASDADNAR